MADLRLGPMLRYVGTDVATIWVETDTACEVEILDARQRTFSVGGHHYALVVVEGLRPGSVTEYSVRLDGEVRWPPVDSPFPSSRIRTLGGDGPVVVLFGSCRSALPHEPPYTLELDRDDRGRGVDALHAVGLRMLHQDESEWPHVMVFGGDQVYADDSAPRIAAHIQQTRPSDGPPPQVVANFEEYTWLYDEAWSGEVERWILSTVASTMIFDDHDMIDDWNISISWVRDIRAQPWWSEHVIGGLVSYWIYQHLGNLSPSRLREEGMLEQLVAVDDATELLRRWAFESEEFTPIPGGYQFSFERHLGDVHLVVIDSRNGRDLEPRRRRMVGEEEWAWVRERALEPTRHLIFVSSLPVFVPGGLHGIQQWSEAIADGRFGRLAARAGERLRRGLDLEGWPAFYRSFRAFEELLVEVATPADGRPEPPVTITVMGGDIHFAYVADVEMPAGAVSAVRQVVCSPLRNVLRTREKRVMRFAASRVGRRLGTWMIRGVRRRRSRLRWEMTHGPVFHNNVGTLRASQDGVTVVVETATLDDDGDERLDVVVRC